MFFGIQHTIHQSGFLKVKLTEENIADFIAGLLHIQANGLSENINSEGLEKMYESDIESIARGLKLLSLVS